MTTIKMFLQRCIVVLGILLCYVHAWRLGDESAVDCEMYPFHHTCRGSMSRKRAMTSVRGPDCDDTEDCFPFRSIEDRQHRLPYDSYPRSKLWMTLLENGFEKDVPRASYPSNYDVRHKKRKNGEKGRYSDRRIPLMDSNFLAELENTDGDY